MAEAGNVRGLSVAISASTMAECAACAPSKKVAPRRALDHLATGGRPCGGRRLPALSERTSSARVPAVWMRDVLGTSDHLKGFGQAAGIERRVVTAIGAVGGRAQALTYDHVR